MGYGMLYIVGNRLPWGIRCDIVYNEFLTRFTKYYQSIKSRVGVSENTGHHRIQIYLQHRSNKSKIICM